MDNKTSNIQSAEEAKKIARDISTKDFNEKMKQGECALPWCKNSIYSSGLCENHYLSQKGN